MTQAQMIKRIKRWLMESPKHTQTQLAEAVGVKGSVLSILLNTRQTEAVLSDVVDFINKKGNK